MKYLWVILVFGLIGCGTPRIKSGTTTVQAQKANEDVTLKKDTSKKTVVAPAGTTVTRTITPAAEGAPAQETQVWTFPGEVSVITDSTHEVASTGKINTKVAEAAIDADERRPLLFMAMACVVGAIFFIWKAYPTGAYLSGVAALVFFLAWKLDDLPNWYWGVGVAAIAVAAGIYFGYEKKEQHLKEGK